MHTAASLTVRNLHTTFVDDEKRRAFISLAEDDVALGVVGLLQPLRQFVEVFRSQRLEERDVRQKFLSCHGLHLDYHCNRLISALMSSRQRKPSVLRRFFGSLGPGLITGAADDDPSGIATYSIAGAQLGTSMLWTALLTWPLMAAVQMMCARIGMVTGYGLASALRRKFPTPVVATAALALLAANIINIGADLSGMADAT